MPRYLGSGRSPEKWFSVWGTASLLPGPGVWPRWCSHKRGTTAPFVHQTWTPTDPVGSGHYISVLPSNTISLASVLFAWFWMLSPVQRKASGAGRQEPKFWSPHLLCPQRAGPPETRTSLFLHLHFLISNMKNFTEPSVWPLPVLFSMDFPGEWEVDYLSNVTVQIHTCFPVLRPPLPTSCLPNEVHLKTWEEKTWRERQGQSVTYITQGERAGLRSTPSPMFPAAHCQQHWELASARPPIPAQEMRAGGRFSLALSKKDLNI